MAGVLVGCSKASVATMGNGGGVGSGGRAETAPGSGGGGSSGGGGGSRVPGSDGGHGGSAGAAAGAAAGGVTGVDAGGGGAIVDAGGGGGAIVDAAVADVVPSGDGSAGPDTSRVEGGGADGATSADATVDTGGGDSQEMIHYFGRWNRLPDRAITVNTGSHVTARFTGTGLSARFDVSLNQAPNPTFAWRIDQNEWQEGELAATMMLATGLAPGAHDVLLMVRGLNENQNRWSPPLASSITFLGFTATAGALQATPLPVRPKIEFLGDSITEGINIWITRAGQTTPCWRSDGRVAYASQAAQALGAEWRQVGFGRQGLLIGGNGGIPTANLAFNFIYQGVPRDNWQPDMVIINQGTNDGGASAAAFRPAYAAFVTTIRAAYRGAKIVALRPFGGAHAAEIKAEVDARVAGGDARVFFVDTTGWLAAADFTDGVHPNAAGSAKAAQALVAAINGIRLP